MKSTEKELARAVRRVRCTPGNHSCAGTIIRPLFRNYQGGFEYLNIVFHFVITRAVLNILC